MPTCTFTAPEVASVGVRTGGALPRGVKTITKQLAHVDRAIVDGDTTGFITLAYNAKGVVVGATVVATRAGELISECAVVISQKMTMAKLANVIHPYPTYGILSAEGADLALAKYLDRGPTTPPVVLQTMAADVYYEQLKSSAGLYNCLKRVGL